MKLFLVMALAGLAQAAPDMGERLVENLIELRFDRLGHPQVKIDAIHPVRSSPERPHRLLVLPVQFLDVAFDRFKGEKNAEEKNRRYFDLLLFSRQLRKPRKETLTHYYFHQSRGRYYVTGEVFPVVTVSKPLAFYGQPLKGSGGEWRNDAAAEGLVVDALQAAYELKPDFPWDEYDIWDPQDYDGDGDYDEPDGYIDHFVLVYAGRGQSSCHGLYKLDEKFTANAPKDLIENISPRERDCANRIWPHRFSLARNIGKGPMVEGFMNGRGGVPLREGLWVNDYNMQSEYTEQATFIHEFGHSLGLPDLYADLTDNSTGSWDAMSATASPMPQELSAWSRMVLGWLKPCMILPRKFGGKKVQSLYLKTMSDWSGRPGGPSAPGVCDAAMVVLEPKFRDLVLGPLEKKRHGLKAAYSGQGNDMRRTLGRFFDLRAIRRSGARRASGAGRRVILEFDAWFEIEADWDYLYIEASLDGLQWTRLMPTDKSSIADGESVMPSKRGHEGRGSTPGFTGKSGDFNGDGKVESSPGCDPKKAKTLAEDRVGRSAKDPCDRPRWVRAAFDLSAYKGRRVYVRFHYYTDGAAVGKGALIDNVEVKALGFREDFEGTLKDWDADGFTLSGGSHHLPVPHFYLLEYRNPYEEFKKVENYDRNLDQHELLFYKDDLTKEFRAVNVRYRPGVLVWYYNGSYLWGQNEPSQSGPGRGFLLVVDSNPQEYPLPPVPGKYFKNDRGWRYYRFDKSAQKGLKKGFVDVMCYQRRSDYIPPELVEEGRACGVGENAPIESMELDGKNLIYEYARINEFLPGPERDRWKGTSSLYDLRVRDEGVTFRLNDRMLRDRHAADAPFSLRPFENAVEYYKPDGNELVRFKGTPFGRVPGFDDGDPSRYMNPHLPFGGTVLPREGLRFMLARPGEEAPEGAKVKIYFEWSR